MKAAGESRAGLSCVSSRCRSNAMKRYLEQSRHIDFGDARIAALAKTLAADAGDDASRAKRCFEWVRDNIMHSGDHEMDPVTCRASDVLKYRTGYCYAKNHLLVALLRANSIPAGLCYQRLSIDRQGPPFFLHGLTAVCLKEYGWYRLDPRGNKEGVDARFRPPVEQLARSIRLPGEADLPEIWSEPLSVVSSALEKYDTHGALREHLPDILLLPETAQGSRPARD